MIEKKRIYESEVMALPPLRLVLGDIPSPDPEGFRRKSQNGQVPGQVMETTVKKLIAHLKENEK